MSKEKDKCKRCGEMSLSELCGKCTKLELEIKSLESRLKEALTSCAEMSTPLGLLPINSVGMRLVVDELVKVKTSYGYEGVKRLQERLSQAEKDIETWKIVSKGEENMRLEDERKLSQAEAELQKHRDETLDGDCERCDYKSFTAKVSEQCERIMELEARLSHLMDVAGKMAGALKTIAERDVPIPDYDWSDWNGGDASSETSKIIAEFAKLALAEWDGIKDGGK